MKRMPFSDRNTKPRQLDGMTLIEIIVVVAIMAVLVALAVPSYQHYAQRGHRADAVRLLLEMAACQERVRAETAYYNTTRCQDRADNAKYGFRVEPEGQNRSMRFKVIATPTMQMSGDDCGQLALDQSGSRSISGKPEALAACWGGR